MKDFAFKALKQEKNSVWSRLQEEHSPKAKRETGQEEFQDEDIDMSDEEEETKPAKKAKATPLQLALSESLEQNLKEELAKERAQHAEEIREMRRKFEEAQREAMKKEKQEADNQIQYAQTQVVRAVEEMEQTKGGFDSMGRRLLEQLIAQNKESMDQMIAKQNEAMDMMRVQQNEAIEKMQNWFVQTQQECIQQIADARDEKQRKTVTGRGS